MSEGRSINKVIVTVIRGMCMGVADAIPGVSGGTIALILGFYDRLIDSISDLIRIIRAPGDPLVRGNFLRALSFLVPLAAGIGSALFVATRLLVGKDFPGAERLGEMSLEAGKTFLAVNPPSGLLINPRTAPLVFAFFFGLVFWSIQDPWKKRREKKPLDFFLFLLGALPPAALALLPGLGIPVHPLTLLGAGALAISVMLLPGISGSLALLVIGMYQPVSAAVHNRQFTTLLIFAAGMIFGVLIFIPILRRILHRYHDRTMAVLSGLMGGSLLALWPWKAHYLPELIPHWGNMTPQAPGDWRAVFGCLLTAVIGGAVIALARRLAPLDLAGSETNAP
jgi:putative membrane protein